MILWDLLEMIPKQIQWVLSIARSGFQTNKKIIKKFLYIYMSISL